MRTQVARLILAAGTFSLAASTASAQLAITATGNLPSWYGTSDGFLSTNSATVVGSLSGPSGQRPYRWTQATGLQNLGVVAGDNASASQGVSADGTTVVGWSSNGTVSHAFVWRAGTGMQSIGFLPGRNTAAASGVSGDGSVVVGASSISSVYHSSHAFRWSSGTGMQDLGVLPGTTWSVASGISRDASTIVGNSFADIVSNPFVWTASGGMQALPIIAGSQINSAHEVNGAGSVIIGEGTFNNRTHAQLWTTGAGGAWTPQDLGSVSGAPMGFSIGQAVSDNGGVAVGYGSSAGGGTCAWAWTPQFGMVDLNVVLPQMGLNLAGWRLDGALGVSADGTSISGWGTGPGGQTSWIVTGITGVIPSPGVMSVLGVFGVAGLRRRR